MAVDTERKRWGMMQWASGPSYYPTLFNPDTNGVDATERATLLKLYGGVAWAGVSYVADILTGVHFDGSTYLTAAAPGLTDSKEITFSCMYKPTAVGVRQVIATVGAQESIKLLVDCSTTGELNIIGRNSIGAEILHATSAAGVFVAGETARIVLSVTLPGVVEMFVNGVDVTPVGPTADDDTLAMTSIAAYVGATSADTLNLVGCLGELIIATTALDVAANYGLFFDADGNAVDKTAAIALLSPEVYLSGGSDSSDPDWFPGNVGSGGAFTVTAGTLADCTLEYTAPVVAEEESATGGWPVGALRGETRKERDERVRRERERLGIIEPSEEPEKLPLVAKDDGALVSQEIDALAAFLEQMEAQDDRNAMKRRRVAMLLLTL